jgi:D-alanyl-lipoteichoic acid acyltransferase DltB (MBOAT superfamily)
MLFNSFSFLLFFPIFLLLYFKIAKKHQWKLLLLSGYYFYGSFAPKYLLILVAITLNDYFAGQKIESSTTNAQKKRWLFLSIGMNLGILFFFKYIDFLDDNVRSLFELLHLPYFVPNDFFNNIIVPVGVSFITFQSLSYTIDIYKGLIKPEKHLGYFATFTAFWPVMVNGPIERAKNLLPQLKVAHDFDYDRTRSGLIRMLFGFFKKLVIADRLAFFVDDMYLHFNDASGWTIILGATLFFFQVYCDFSGYSDIALGAARIMGINITENFKRPFFSKNLAEFWTRWHVSLSTWLTDYVFFYLGAYKSTGMKVVFNVIFVLTICGLWHGANWPMILAFSMIGVAMAIRYLWQYNVVRNIKPSNAYKLFDKYFPDWAHVATTIAILVFCFLLFRVHTAQQVWNAMHPTETTSWWHIASLLYTKLFHLASANYFYAWITHKGIVEFVCGIFFLATLVFIEYKIGDTPIDTVIMNKSKNIRWLIYILFALSITWFGVFNNTSFVYFQY